jgi:hypothetical protein
VSCGVQSHLSEYVVRLRSLNPQLLRAVLCLAVLYVHPSSPAVSLAAEAAASTASEPPSERARAYCHPVPPSSSLHTSEDTRCQLQTSGFSSRKVTVDLEEELSKSRETME